MRKVTVLLLVFCFANILAVETRAQGGYGGYGGYGDQYEQQYGYEPYTPDQLDNLLAPIALYPDPLLAQVLVAATFPDQIEDAARFVRRYGNNIYAVDDQPWDVSVKAVAHYPAVLYMMNDQIDWTIALGQAYVNQSTDTIGSIQHLRALARAQGNLFSTSQQQVIFDRGYIMIVPAQPRYIFVPTYDPGAIYTRRVYNGSSFGGFFSFGTGFVIGAWLNYDLDWGSHRVVYDGWNGSGWRQRSRPYVNITNVYVNNRYQNVTVNRTVVNRQLNYANVDRFNSVHRDVKFGDHARFNGRQGDRNSGGHNNNEPNRNGSAPQNAPSPRPDQRFDRSSNPSQVPPAAPQQAPQVPRQDNTYRGRQNDGRQQDRTPAATPQPTPQVPRQNDNGYRGQQNGSQNGRQNDNRRDVGRQDQAPPAAPQQQAPQVPRQNDNGIRGGQNQAPPARVEQPAARPAPPPTAQPAPAAPAGEQRQRGGNGNGNDKGNDKDNGNDKNNGKDKKQ